RAMRRLCPHSRCHPKEDYENLHMNANSPSGLRAGRGWEERMRKRSGFSLRRRTTTCQKLPVDSEDKLISNADETPKHINMPRMCAVTEVGAREVKLYWKHLSKLSEAVHILLRDSLSHRDIKRAEELLNAFVCRVEALYGIGAMTFNMHLLLHLASCVHHLGPPWAHSAFVFDGGNGMLVNLVSAAKGLPQQVVERVMMAQELELLLASHHLPNRVERICHGFLGYMPVQSASQVEETTMLGCGGTTAYRKSTPVSTNRHSSSTNQSLDMVKANEEVQRRGKRNRTRQTAGPSPP
ncbi:hypothetical protein HPB47_021571, partial [Ixodes persulcatus]